MINNTKSRSRILSATVVSVLMFIATEVPANTMPAVTAYVSDVGTYEDGSIYVYFDRQISSCGTTTRLDIADSHPAKTQVLSIAMAAFLSGKPVRIHPGSCAGGLPAFGSEGDSYFYLTSSIPS